MDNALSIINPQLAAQWHPTKNGTLTPDHVAASSGKKVWWICLNGLDHEWEASPNNRAKGKGCPCCSGRKPSVTNSLASLYPEIAAQWHPIKNGTLTPAQLVAGSHKKAWWRCPNQPDHQWEASIADRVKGSGCHFCTSRKPCATNSLVSLYPEIAIQWHPTKNGTLIPDQVVAGSNKKVWWKCPNGSDHEWEVSPSKRINGTGCPFCAGNKSSSTNSLASLYPEIAKQWHPRKNGMLTPDQVVSCSGKKAWWICPNNANHEWKTSVAHRVKGTGCPFCTNRKSSVNNSLASLYPKIAVQWHPSKNKTLTPDQIVAGSHKKVWWQCPHSSDHEWEATIVSRVKAGNGCPCCAGLKPSVTNSLASLYHKIAQEWHPTKNGILTPTQVIAGSSKKVWWRCSIDSSHEWEASIDKRTKRGRGCPACNLGWTVQAIRGFIASLKNHIEAFTPAELYLLFQQSGLLQSKGKGKGFVKALATGRFPIEEIEKFANGEPSIVDSFLQDKDLTLEAIETSSNNNILEKKDKTSENNHDEQIDETVEPSEEQDDLNLPIVQTKEVLKSLDHNIVSSADEEAVEFLIASAKAKIWKHAFQDETAAIAQAETYTGDNYAERVKTEFLDEYHHAKNLHIPTGYAFQIKGKLTLPNLMQRLIAVRVRDQKRVGNWSGTGAGKTLSAVLASRVINARITVICCPNSVIEGWKKAILGIFPDSIVATKTFTPNWEEPNPPTPFPTREGGVFLPSPRRRGAGGEVNRYLILNYEMFQQPNSPDWVRSLVNNEQIDFIVIDEIHYTKQRQVEDMSRRKQLVSALITAAIERNSDLHVIGMSATPVINNLQEGKSLVEMVTGVAHDELDIRPTVPNCMKLHQRLVTLGIRWMPEYNLEYEQVEIPVDCEDFIDQIRALGNNGTPLELEKILTLARLPVIRSYIQPKTLIYTHYIQGIDRLLREALENDGWKVGFIYR